MPAKLSKDRLSIQQLLLSLDRETPAVLFFSESPHFRRSRCVRVIHAPKLCTDKRIMQLSILPSRFWNHSELPAVWVPAVMVSRGEGRGKAGVRSRNDVLRGNTEGRGHGGSPKLPSSGCRRAVATLLLPKSHRFSLRGKDRVGRRLLQQGTAQGQEEAQKSWCGRCHQVDSAAGATPKPGQLVGFRAPRPQEAPPSAE